MPLFAWRAWSRRKSPTANTGRGSYRLQVELLERRELLDATIQGFGLTITPTKGQPFTGAVAQFNDANLKDTPANLTATIDWGDGTQPTTGSVTGGQGQFTVAGTHTYQSEGPFTNAGFTTTITLSETSPGTASDTTTGQAYPDRLIVTANHLNLTEGQTFTGAVATFTEANQADTAANFIAVDFWGDGTTTRGTIAGGQGNFTVSDSHTYQDEGNYILGVGIYANGVSRFFTSASNGSVRANEGDGLLAPEVPANITTTAFQTFSGTVGTFFNNGYVGNSVSDFTATVNWGDGSTTAGTISSDGKGNFTVQGTHQYTQPGTFGVTVSLADDAPGTASASTTTHAAVAPNPFTVQAGAPIHAAAGVPFSKVLALFSYSVPLSPNGSAPAPVIAATIAWGDGTQSAGMITHAGNGFQVIGNHVYAVEGNYNVQVVLTDGLGTTRTVATPAIVGGFLTSLYHDVLKRAPDPVGLAFWTAQLQMGVSHEAVAADFLASPEYATFVVTQLYQQILNRAPDSSALGSAVFALTNGTTVQSLVIGLLTSDEYRSKHMSTAAFVTGVYEQVFNRAPSATELSTAVGQLDSGAVTPPVFIQGLLGTTEAFQSAIRDNYMTILHRAPSSAEEAKWLNQLSSGTVTPLAFAATFYGGAEYTDLANALAMS